MLCFIVLKKTQCENSSLKKLANYLCHWTTHMRNQGLCDSMCGANLTIYDKFVYNVDETPCKISCIALKVLVWVGYSYPTCGLTISQTPYPTRAMTFHDIMV